MKILSLSDLHIDINNKYLNTDITKSIINMIKREKPAIILIAGDISDDANLSLEIIDRIEYETGTNVYFIPGNHDIKINSNINNSWKQYEIIKQHKSSVIDNPIHLNDEYILIGDMGWYDYSFGDKTIDAVEYAMHKKLLWVDGFSTSWGITDIQLFNIMHDKLKKQLDSFRDKKIIFMNHFIPYEKNITFKNEDLWDFNNGFMGSKQLGELIDQYNNIKYVIFGHTHKRYGLKKDKNRSIICNPLGYFSNDKLGKSDNEIEKAKIIFNI